MTAGQTDQQSWIVARRNGIGASESPILFGCGYSGQTPVTLYARKLGLLPETEDTERMQAGRYLETGILAWASDILGRPVVPNGRVLWHHPERAWMLATPDGLLTEYIELPDTPKSALEAVVEAKCIDAYFGRQWEDEPPLRVQIQVQHQLYCTGLGVAYVAALVGGNRLMLHRVERHEAFIGRLCETVDEFWHEHVLKQVPPPVDGTEATAKALARLWTAEPEGSIELSGDDWAKFDAALRNVKARQSALEKERTLLENQLRAAMGPATVAILPRGVRYSWRQQVAHYEAREAKTVSTRVLRRLTK